MHNPRFFLFDLRILKEDGIMHGNNAPIAQLVEQLPLKETVQGSIPCGCTNKYKRPYLWPFIFVSLSLQGIEPLFHIFGAPPATLLAAIGNAVSPTRRSAEAPPRSPPDSGTVFLRMLDDCKLSRSPNIHCRSDNGSGRRSTPEKNRFPHPYSCRLIATRSSGSIDGSRPPTPR